MTANYRFVIIGAGAAGLQAAYYLHQAGADYCVLEKSNCAGTFYKKYPRRRQLISFNRVNTIFSCPKVNLRFDWNSLLTDDYSFPFREVSDSLYPSADDLVAYLQAFATRFQLNIKYNHDVRHIARGSDPSSFKLTLAQEGEIIAETLIVASGFGKPFVPDIPGIELTEGYEDADLNPDGFRDKKILVIGKGNSAFEVADLALDQASLVHMASPRAVKLAWQSRHPGHVRANHVRLLDSYQLKLLNGTLDCNVLSISRHDNSLKALVSYVHADGEEEELVYDRIIRCAGFKFDPTVFDDSILPETVLGGKLPATTPFWESVNVKNLFFAGTLTQARDFKRSSSAFIGGYRYNTRTLCKFLLGSNQPEGCLAPCVSFDSKILAARILERCNTNSALWAQFGYLSDVLVKRRETYDWYQELPYQALGEGLFHSEEHVLSLTFEWGEWSGDVMEVQRHPTASKAFTNVFLHPILRRYRYGILISEHHILEDLFGVYSADGEQGNVISRGGLPIDEYHQVQHVQPLEAFFNRNISDKVYHDFLLAQSGDCHPGGHEVPMGCEDQGSWDG